MTPKYNNSLAEMLIAFSKVCEETYKIKDSETKVAHAGGILAVLGFMQEIVLVVGTSEDQIGVQMALDNLRSQINDLTGKYGQEIPDEVSFSFPISKKYDA